VLVAPDSMSEKVNEDEDEHHDVEIKAKDRTTTFAKSILRSTTLNQRRTISFARVRRSRARKEKMRDSVEQLFEEEALARERRKASCS